MPQEPTTVAGLSIPGSCCAHCGGASLPDGELCAKLLTIDAAAQQQDVNTVIVRCPQYKTRTD